jgi:hypothetical protein
VWPPPAPSAAEDSTAPTPARTLINPRLIPSPADPYTPQIMWDLAEMPSVAKRLTGNHFYADLKSIETEQAVWPKSDVVHVTTWFNNYVNWGPIVAKNADGVTLIDLLWAIYHYFQERISQVLFQQL